jgi:hypothetical protein
VRCRAVCFMLSAARRQTVWERGASRGRGSPWVDEEVVDTKVSEASRGTVAPTEQVGEQSRVAMKDTLPRICQPRGSLYGDWQQGAVTCEDGVTLASIDEAIGHVEDILRGAVKGKSLEILCRRRLRRFRSV